MLRRLRIDHVRDDHGPGEHNVFGWRVRRPALESSELRGATRSGSPCAAAASPPRRRHHRPGARVHVVVRSGGRVVRRAVVVAGASGRVTVRFTLGPGNRGGQQHTPGTVTRVFTTAVTLHRAG